MFLDIKGAFGSCNRKRTFFDLAAKFPGDKFVHKLKNIYNNLKMQVDLGFTDKSDVEVEYLTGNPEGSAASDRIWVSLMGSIVTYVRHPDRCPNACLIIYADDIAVVAASMVELQSIYTNLTRALDYFCLRFDPKKFNFIRFGDCDDEEIFLFEENDNITVTRFSESVR